MNLDDVSTRAEICFLAVMSQLVSSAQLGQTGLVPDFQLSFDWSIATHIDYKKRLNPIFCGLLADADLSPNLCQNDEDESGEDEESSDSEKGSANGDAGATQEMLMDAMPMDDDP